MANRNHLRAVAAVLGAAIAALLVALPGCRDGDGGDMPRARNESGPRPPIPVIGRGRRYRPRPAGTLVSARRPLGRLRCTRVARDTYGTHLEIFLKRRDVVIPAGIGVAPPHAREGAYVKGGRCWYPIRTLEPTGLIEIDEGRKATLGELFDLWGQPLSERRLLGLHAGRGESVIAFVNGRRWRGDLRSMPLARHAAIVLELGGYFPPTRRYAFPRSL